MKRSERVAIAKKIKTKLTLIIDKEEKEAELVVQRHKSCSLFEIDLMPGEMSGKFKLSERTRRQ